MGSFSLGTIWEQTVAFIRRERALLIPVALALFGPAQVMIELAATQGMPANPAEPASRGGGVLLMLPAMVLVFFANLVITRLVLVPGVSVGEALSGGLRRLLPALGATLLIGIGLSIVAIAIVTAASLGILVFGGDPRSPTITAQIVALIMIPAIILLVRMMLLVPMLAVEDRGVIDGVRRGWALGHGNALRLGAVLAIIVLLTGLVQMVQMVVIGSVIQLIELTTGHGDLLLVAHMLINAAIDAMLSLGFAVYLAFAYRSVAQGPA